jgi:beta-lactamase superfamily II metal-dependent hydrolase
LKLFSFFGIFNNVRGATNENGVYNEVNNIAKKLEEKGNFYRVQAHSGQSIELGDGAVLKILYPDREITGLPTNDASIVALLEYKKESFLLTGDAPLETEFRLLRNPLLQKVTVLKVGHHGSQYSTGSLFLDRIRPDFAVISVGKNTYGHPTQTVLDILKDYNVNVLRTDKSGTISFFTNGESISYMLEK